MKKKKSEDFKRSGREARARATRVDVKTLQSKLLLSTFELFFKTFSSASLLNNKSQLIFILLVNNYLPVAKNPSGCWCFQPATK